MDGQKKEFNLLITKEDKTGTNLSEMSNFSDLAMQQLKFNYDNQKDMFEFSQIPFSDIGIVVNAIEGMGTCVKKSINYVLDMDSLPKEIQEGLRTGKYEIAKSKQVDGNFRAVIRETGNKKLRVKDITLKEEVRKEVQQSNPNAFNNILIQLQMKQITEKLDEILIMQEHMEQILKDQFMGVPFDLARHEICNFQESKEKNTEYLDKALDYLDKSITSCYRNIFSSSDKIYKLRNRIILANEKMLRKFMKDIMTEWQLITICTYMRLYILAYLEKDVEIKTEIERFNNNMYDFCIKPSIRGKISYAMQIHRIFPYNKENVNFWINIINSAQKANVMLASLQYNKEVHLIRMEG